METTRLARSRLLRLGLVGWFVVVAWLAADGTAHAACHAFTVEASPSTADEGMTVTVTIKRDADVDPSSVRVRTVDETATGGSDYTPLDERVEFSSGTEQEREVDILDDQDAEEDETFGIELSEGEGCTVNPNFTYDSTTVTIADDDPADDTSPSPSPTSDGSADDSADEDSADEGSDDEGSDDLPRTGAGAGVALAGVGLLAAAGAVRRRHVPER